MRGNKEQWDQTRPATNPPTGKGEARGGAQRATQQVVRAHTVGGSKKQESRIKRNVLQTNKLEKETGDVEGQANARHSTRSKDWNCRTVERRIENGWDGTGCEQTG